MAWQISGRSMELCSCKALCPCWLGPEGVPDQEWCAGIFGFDVESGNSGGAELTGSKVFLIARWPGNFFAGNGSARLYIDESATPEQQRELEGIFSGKKGGLLEPLWGAVISNWHPTKTGKVEIKWGDAPSIKVDGVGAASLKPFCDEAGNQATLSGAAAMAAFQMERMVLADGRESRFSDPDLGDWQGDSGTLHSFNWAG